MTDHLNRPLNQLTPAERREALEDLVAGQFRAMLMMLDDEELPTDISYFDLGLTSLRLTELKQRLEGVLDLGIDATVLFNRPTIDDLVDYLTELLSEETAAPALLGEPVPH